MSALTGMLPALLIVLCAVYAALQGVDVFAGLLRGARQGLRIWLKILPSLVCLLPAVAMLRAAGAMDAFTSLLEPLLERLRIPADCAPLMLLRPVSGSAALAAGGELLERFGADSLTGRTAAVMLGSTETTFYVLSVYFGAAGVKKSRHAVPAALCADLTGFLAAAWTVRILFS